MASGAVVATARAIRKLRDRAASNSGETSGGAVDFLSTRAGRSLASRREGEASTDEKCVRWGSARRRPSSERAVAFRAKVLLTTSNRGTPGQRRCLARLVGISTSRKAVPAARRSEIATEENRGGE